MYFIPSVNCFRYNWPLYNINSCSPWTHDGFQESNYRIKALEEHSHRSWYIIIKFRLKQGRINLQVQLTWKRSFFPRKHCCTTEAVSGPSPEPLLPAGESSARFCDTAGALTGIALDLGSTWGRALLYNKPSNPCTWDILLLAESSLSHSSLVTFSKEFVDVLLSRGLCLKLL